MLEKDDITYKTGNEPIKDDVTDSPPNINGDISNSNIESNSIDDNNFYIQIKLTDKAKYALLNSEDFVGSCHISIKRKKKHKKKLKEVEVHPDYESLVRYWNEHPVISLFEASDRNNPIVYDELIKNITTFKQVFEKYNLNELKSFIDEYLIACKRGINISNGFDYAYKSLITFLTSLLKITEKRWWAMKNNVKDDNPELTIKIANAYAKEFLGRKEYGLNSSNSMYNDFRLAAVYCKKAYDSFSMYYSVTMDDIVRCLLESVKNTYRNGCSPRSLISDLITKDKCPQVIKKMVGA